MIFGQAEQVRGVLVNLRAGTGNPLNICQLPLPYRGSSCTFNLFAMKTAFDLSPNESADHEEAQPTRHSLGRVEKAALSRAWENRRYQIFLGISVAALLLLLLYGSFASLS